MAVGRLRELCEVPQLDGNAQLPWRWTEAAGYPEDCPAAVVERATTPKQRTFRGDITTLPDIAVENKVKVSATGSRAPRFRLSSHLHSPQAPAVIVVGEVVRVLDEAQMEAYRAAEIGVQTSI
eukprot:scaffold3349_cov246-Pinguiococcus_pyrenoidosus.AAC.2